MSNDSDNENDNIFNPADFVPIKLKINLINTTTHAEIRDGKRYYDKKQKNDSEDALVVLISEFLEDGLMLEIPSKMCAQNHHLTIEVTTENTNPIIHFSENLKVKSVEKISADSDLIETTFIQKNTLEWERLESLYSKRQEEIRNFINSVKGYDRA